MGPRIVIQTLWPPPGRALQRLSGRGNAAPRAFRSDAGGQAVVELALCVPLLLFLIILAVNFGGWLYSWIEVGNAARAAANYAILSGASADLPIPATAAGLIALINTELASLPNTTSSNPSISVCTYYNGGAPTSITGTCPAASSAVNDPELATYVSAAVDITFTYSPYIPTFSFSGLGIGLPGIPATIHRRTVMRMIQ